MSIELSNLKITRNEINSKNVPELFELFNIDKLPIATADVEFEIKGVSVAVINAFRRTITDEMVGNYLQIPEGGISQLTTDKFADPQFINNRLNTIRLCYQIPNEVIQNLRLEIDVTNTSSEALFIHSGDLVIKGVKLNYPLFNPTYNLFTVQPGKRVVIENIFINSAIGKDFAAANITCKACYKHLDIPEYTREETHTQEGTYNNFSGYKESSLVSNPRHHLFKVLIPATTIKVKEEVSSIFIDGCNNIISRLRYILSSIQANNNSNNFNNNEDLIDGIYFMVLKLPSGLEKGTLIISGETNTIGQVIRRSIYDLVPNIADISDPNVSGNKLKLIIKHTDNVTKILIDAIQHSLLIFNNIKKQF